VHRAEQHLVDRVGDDRVLDGGLDEHDVAPAVVACTAAGEIEHLCRGVDAD
jgi:hypothetical protein